MAEDWPVWISPSMEVCQPRHTGPEEPESSSNPIELIDFSVLSISELISPRNWIIEGKCAEFCLSVSNIDTLSSEETDKPWQRSEYYSSCENYELKRIDKVVQATIREISGRLHNSSEDKFDYWTFQALMKRNTIMEETNWLTGQLSLDNKEFIRRKRRFNNQPIVEQFGSLYGVINEASTQGHELLRSFKTFTEELEDQTEIKLKMMWELKKVIGEEMVAEIINDMTVAEMEGLLLAAQYWGSRWSSVMQDKRFIYNVNPITNWTHSEWFLIPRFRNPPGPSSLFIRQKALAVLTEYQEPPGMIFINGYWPSLMDLTFTHPVRWCDDPIMDASNASSIPHREVNFEVLHERMRGSIKKFPLGIELSRFFSSIRDKHYHGKDVPFFPNISEKKAAQMLPDLFLTSELPGRNDLILFPAFMKEMLRVTDDVFPALEILKKTWKKTIFTVKINSGRIRSRDLAPLIFKYWRLKVNVVHWGFLDVKDFVDWCMGQWNEGGNGEGVTVQFRTGAKNDPFLVYKPRN